MTLPTSLVAFFDIRRRSAGVGEEEFCFGTARVNASTAAVGTLGARRTIALGRVTLVVGLLTTFRGVCEFQAEAMHPFSRHRDLHWSTPLGAVRETFTGLGCASATLRPLRSWDRARSWCACFLVACLPDLALLSNPRVVSWVGPRVRPVEGCFRPPSPSLCLIPVHHSWAHGLQYLPVLCVTNETENPR